VGRTDDASHLRRADDGALLESAIEEGIRERGDVARVAREIALRSWHGNSARVWVVKVDSSLWQEAVLQIAMKSQRILIDVSHTSTNVSGRSTT
jgi:uncharacterized protein YaeQ